MAIERLGQWLRTQREAREWTQADLARRTGTEPMSISRWERGANDPTLKQFALLCHALEASADDALSLRPRSIRSAAAAKKRRRQRAKPKAESATAATPLV